MFARPATPRNEPLHHPIRQEIYGILKERPGMNRRGLQQALDTSTGGLSHHLERLEDEGLVVKRPSTRGNEVLLFTDHDADLWMDQQTRVLYGGPWTRDVALLVHANPGLTAAEIANVLQRSEVTIRHHLRKLQNADLVRSKRQGRKRRYDPTDVLRTWCRERGSDYVAQASALRSP